MPQVTGEVVERTDQNGFGDDIDGAKISFWEKESGAIVEATSEDGRYKVTLNEGRYWVEAEHPEYDDFRTFPGLIIAHNPVETYNLYLDRRGGRRSRERAIAELDRLVNVFPGELGVFAKDLRRERIVGVNADSPFYLASTAKVPIAVGAVDALTDKSDLDATHTIELGDYREENKNYRYHDIGRSIPYRDLLRSMIDNSDTTATDMVVETAGRQSINRTLNRLGIDGLNPVTSMADLDRITWANINDTWASVPSYALEAVRRDGNTEFLVPAHLESVPQADEDSGGAAQRYRATGLNSATPRAIGELAERIAERRALGESWKNDVLADVVLSAGLASGSDSGWLGNLLRGTDTDDVVDLKGGAHDRVLCELAVVYDTPDRSSPEAIVGVFAQEYGLGRTEVGLYLAEAARLAYEALGKAPTPRSSPTLPSSSAPAIVFERPWLGQFFEAGQRAPIRWLSRGVPGPLTLELVKGGGNGSTVEQISANVRDDGEWRSWTVPESVAPGTDYRFRLTDSTGVTALSSYFALRGVIKVPEPYLGENHPRGSVPQIRWATEGVSGQLGIEVVTRLDSSSRRSTITRNANDDGAWQSWEVPSTIPEGSTARVHVWSIDDPEVEGWSSEFTIGGAVRVTAPNAGEAVAVSSTPTIRWETEDVDDALEIRLFRGENTQVGPPIATNAIDDGKWQSWTVPSHLDDGRGYRIEVRSRRAPKISGTSRYFTIGGALEWLVPSVEQAPFAADELQPNDTPNQRHARPHFFAYGTTPTLRWRTHGTVPGPLRLELLRNSGVVDVITNRARNDGAWQSWTPDSDLPASSRYQFRLTDTTRETIVATSQFFSVGSLVDIGLPRVGGRQRTSVQRGSSPQIRWRTENVTEPLTLELHRVGRTDPVLTITTIAKDDGEWRSWTVPNLTASRFATDRDYRFKLISNDNPEVYGYSPWFSVL